MYMYMYVMKCHDTLDCNVMTVLTCYMHMVMLQQGNKCVLSGCYMYFP